MHLKLPSGPPSFIWAVGWVLFLGVLLPPPPPFPTQHMHLWALAVSQQLGGRNKEGANSEGTAIRIYVYVTV